jgi:transposase-like protein
MEKHEESRYIKRTQKDYTMSFKLQIVQEIERGKISITEATKQYGIQCRKTVVEWLRKYGNFDWEDQIPLNMPKSS